ncbi:bifunctional enoyl-CoA hydratase/phosphate acetyltransferase [Thermosediminibacter oceani]|uniref:Phosphate butyryltransferase n=1 Tax=Thermosediminibacter oceani (strain ATCC BAA-1034 / DSM 16646 / JW/IW-1228P) TaxID=555079 RepID=D9S2G5_THEOJ|nr:bifunctional enoyl-CoA hydratase/phosphate acetyltransferase [Thermosediminibacter oceani]ADL07592.1 Phosphate butyryltransferase [Thermosediminibacter oceani DSM 16646]
MESLQEIVEKARQSKPKVMAVVKAEDDDVLKAVKTSQELGLVKSVLIGDKKKIESIMDTLGMEKTNIEIIDEQDTSQAVGIAVELAKKGEVQVLMKGLLQTKDFLKGIVSGDKSLTGGRLLSHVAVFQVPHMKKLVLVTDAAMNISPDLSQKYQIMKNSLSVARSLQIKNPRVAILSAVEVVNPSIPSTMDAAIISKMAQRERLEAVVDGPLALDNAVSKEACIHKGIDSAVGGEADILLVPDLISGNILYKSLVYFARAKVAGIVAGAEVPVVLTSRADSDESKTYSIALSVLMG